MSKSAIKKSVLHYAAIVAALLLASCAHSPGMDQESFRLTIIGTNDVHGALATDDGRGGLVSLSGYVNAARQARSADGGSVLLIDAGDMWQGTLESNLNEGQAVVAAYNAMAYTAAAIGNHEFDFGPSGPLAIPHTETDDPRGNLKLRASEMQFPLLAANLIDKETGSAVDWENVSSSVMIDVQGIQVGIIGVMTERALVTTIASNVVGLEVEPLASAIEREARVLRHDGAQIVLVTAHAGGSCDAFDDPNDLSSCDTESEIFRVAQALPKGLVDHISAGHKHARIAHIVNGISITSGYAQTNTFSRVDLIVNRQTGSIENTEIFAPQRACLYLARSNLECAFRDSAAVQMAVYEGFPVTADAAVVEIATRALAAGEAAASQKLGPVLETPFSLVGNPESALGNVLLEAMLAGTPGDIAILNVTGGIRAELPAGELTYGDVYEAFPFDNRTVVLPLTGRDVREVIARQVHKHGRRAGIGGLRVYVECQDDVMKVRLQLDDGREIADTDQVDVITNDFLALGGDGIFAPVMPASGFDFDLNGTLARRTFIDWFEAHAGQLHADDYLNPEAPRWNLPESPPESCTLPPR